MPMSPKFDELAATALEAVGCSEEELSIYDIIGIAEAIADLLDWETECHALVCCVYFALAMVMQSRWLLKEALKAAQLRSSTMTVRT